MEKEREKEEDNEAGMFLQVPTTGGSSQEDEKRESLSIPCHM
jgi:hypothetical protein